MSGTVVCSRAGRDKGKFMVVIGQSGAVLLVADGKERPLKRPKRKNPKHLAFTKSVLEEKQYSTDKSLRRALAEYRGADVGQKED